MHPQKFTSAPTEGQTFYWSIYDSRWQHQIARTQAWQAKWAVFKILGFVCKRFLTFPPYPLPATFTRAVFCIIFHSRSSFLLWNRTDFNSSYAGYKRWQDSLPKGRLRQGQRRYKVAYYTTWTPATLSLQKELHCLWFCVTIYWISILSENIDKKIYLSNRKPRTFIRHWLTKLNQFTRFKLILHSTGLCGGDLQT